MMRLHDRIAARIRAEGPLRFDAFQEAALYDPEGGYYEREGRVGRGGDFVTGPSWHPAFGRTIARIARRLREEWRREEKRRFLRKGKRSATARRLRRVRLDIVDVGAGEGELLAAADEALRAWGVREQLPPRRRRTLGRAPRTGAAERAPAPHGFLHSKKSLPRSAGLVVAYELFDALPVRALFFEGEKLLERVVTLGPDGEGFAWGLAECADGAELLERFRARGIHLLRNQKLEIRPGAAASRVGPWRSGSLPASFSSSTTARPRRPCTPPRARTERSRRSSRTPSRATSCPEPGSRDLTAWVDFHRARARRSRRAGLDVAGPVSQSRVLASAGIFEDLAIDADAPPDAAREADRRAAAALVQPGGMGESIRVLLASRGTALGSTLASWPRHK